MSENIVHHISLPEEREIERVEKIADYEEGSRIRFGYEIDCNDIRYRGIDLVDFEKACIVSRMKVREEMKERFIEDYEEVLEEFVTTLEFSLFDGLYLGDTESLLEESELLLC